MTDLSKQNLVATEPPPQVRFTAALLREDDVIQFIVNKLVDHITADGRLVINRKEIVRGLSGSQAGEVLADLTRVARAAALTISAEDIDVFRQVELDMVEGLSPYHGRATPSHQPMVRGDAVVEGGSEQRKPAKAEVTRRDSYVQPGREGKKLIGAYVPEEDITKFKAIMKARGTNVQDFFAQVVANEIAAAANPAELERLMEAQLDRFRATLRQTLKR